ncbi:MAG: DNA-processing protein DprA [Spirochaetales bacterium]
MSDDVLRLRLFLLRLSFLRCGEKELLEKKISRCEDFITMSFDELSIAVGRVLKRTLWNPRAIILSVERDIKLMEAYRIGLVFYDSPHYPPLLREIYDYPYALFYRGDFSSAHKPCIAVVGTRKPTQNVITQTRIFTEELAGYGFTVVSGLAFGVDACAHRGALNAGVVSACGKTVAVLGSGVDSVTPFSNKRLGAAILESGGCLVSEYPPGEAAQKWHFVQRNRIISALSSAIIVMQAPPGSGSLITADFALEHNRELYFYADAVDFDRALFEKSNNLLSGVQGKIKKRVSDYIEEGACVIDCAKQVYDLHNHDLRID